MHLFTNENIFTVKNKFTAKNSKLYTRSSKKAFNSIFRNEKSHYTTSVMALGAIYDDKIAMNKGSNQEPKFPAVVPKPAVNIAARFYTSS